MATGFKSSSRRPGQRGRLPGQKNRPKGGKGADPDYDPAKDEGWRVGIPCSQTALRRQRRQAAAAAAAASTEGGQRRRTGGSEAYSSGYSASSGGSSAGEASDPELEEMERNRYANGPGDMDQDSEMASEATAAFSTAELTTATVAAAGGRVKGAVRRLAKDSGDQVDDEDELGEVDSQQANASGEKVRDELEVDQEITETWMPEESLSLWEIRTFIDSYFPLGTYPPAPGISLTNGESQSDSNFSKIDLWHRQPRLPSPPRVNLGRLLAAEEQRYWQRIAEKQLTTIRSGLWQSINIIFCTMFIFIKNLHSKTLLISYISRFRDYR
ncbi:unnamed protein product [Protopolystoma xenopodis]|uniref:Uncharacterized protein n=1 Tax=Protopolystoma xenopodis TaxID=117903 RepID=A0A448WUT0_9PLAT|nr:unnamed protein product [Protopolystoma xenopodis]